MTRRPPGWVVCAALAACTPLYPEPDAGPTNELLLLRKAEPNLGVLLSDRAPGGACRLVIVSVQVVSTSPDAGGAIVGTAYLNLDSNPLPTPRNNSALPFFSQLAFKPDGPDIGSQQLFDYSLQQGSLAISLDPLVYWLFARNDPRTNYLTLTVTDGPSTMNLVWGLDLSQCDPRPF